MGMTYIDYLNDFNRWLESNALPSNSQLLYFRLLDVFNRAGWPEYVQVDNLRLMLWLGATTKPTVIRAREKLVETGFIAYLKGKKGSPNKYVLLHKKGISGNTINDTINDTISNTINDTTNDTHIKSKIKTKKGDKSPLPPCADLQNLTAEFSPALKAAFADWLQYKQERGQTYKPTGLARLAGQVRQKAAEYGESAVIDLMSECMANNWQGIIWDKLSRKRSGQTVDTAPVFKSGTDYSKYL